MAHWLLASLGHASPKGDVQAWRETQAAVETLGSLFFFFFSFKN